MNETFEDKRQRHVERMNEEYWYGFLTCAGLALPLATIACAVSVMVALWMRG